MTPWSLSVFYFYPQNDPQPKLLHLGYMKKSFSTKSQAMEYYNVHNPHMRPLQDDSERSDWDPETKLVYVPVPHPPWSGQFLRAWEEHSE